MIAPGYGGEYPTVNLPNVPTDPNFFWGMPHNGYCIATEGIYPTQDSVPSENDIIGQVILMPPPTDDGYSGVFPCDGRVLHIGWGDGLQGLFEVIGSTYGGDGQNTVALPKLSPPLGLEKHMYFIVAYGIYPASDD